MTSILPFASILNLSTSCSTPPVRARECIMITAIAYLSYSGLCNLWSVHIVPEAVCLSVIPSEYLGLRTSLFIDPYPLWLQLLSLLLFLTSFRFSLFFFSFHHLFSGSRASDSILLFLSLLLLFSLTSCFLQFGFLFYLNPSRFNFIHLSLTFIQLNSLVILFSFRLSLTTS